MNLKEFASLLRDFLQSEVNHLWIIDNGVHFDGEIKTLEAAFASSDSDMLATALRRYAEEPGWHWWSSLQAPKGEKPLSHGVAMLLPLIRLSRQAAEAVLKGFEEGWNGHLEAVIPTLVNRAGLKIEDIGGFGSFTPPDRIGRWYDDRTWHWEGPVSFVPGKLHYPVNPRDPVWSTDIPAPKPTIAFLFLTRGEMNHPGIWQEYLDVAGDHARIYAHTKSLDSLPAGSFLLDAQINERMPTAWGAFSLVEATLAMIRAALEDPAVTHVALVSESCVPVRPFSSLARSLRLDKRSRLAMRSLDQVRSWGNREKALRLEALSGIPKDHAWFQDQWMCLNRRDALIVSEKDWSPHFKDVWAADECFFSTVLSASGRLPGEAIINRPITWTCWRGGAHPQEFHQVLPRIAAEIMESGCYFARKFTPGSNIGRWDLHRDSCEAAGAFHFEKQLS
ncbi:hypothetical protein HNR46_003986 [Haloferula luteola]|uniref:Uncharacterized protein n=1 Tax=Haloferula luteola TaxID=595692 RepID=A0A840V6S5_9BACT|nr:beta-1,6-N-acetylglucosaminyltransferase [Haloferula luteola]MBB5353725.1 hypothetical protein [Haloferula luteola]